MKALRCACNLINVTQYTSTQSFFILKQGYMFRLKVSHLQALTTFSLPDALPTFGIPKWAKHLVTKMLYEPENDF